MLNHNNYEDFLDNLSRRNTARFNAVIISNSAYELELRVERYELKEENKKLKKQNKKILKSNSWKITKPLRSIRNK